MPKINIPFDFNPENYRKLYNDLSNMNENELIEHYIHYGYYENRIYKIDLPFDFNPENYKKLYNDLSNMNESDLIEHYIHHGYYENRIYKIDLPFDFNLENYKKLYNDLSNMNENELIEHYIHYGYYENRIYKIDLPEDFNPENYRKLYNDLSNMNEKELIEHYIHYGYYENRIYKIDLPENFNKVYIQEESLQINELNNIKLSEDFNKVYIQKESLKMNELSNIESVNIDLPKDFDEIDEVDEVQIKSLKINELSNFMNFDKITIIMTYYNRRNQILQTLNKFNELYSNYNLEVIIVDDCSEYNEQLFLTIQSYNFKIKLIRLKNKSWINPVVAYNVGISHISKDTKYVIIQNSEILHCDDIIKYTINSLTKEPNNYLSFNVFNSPSFSHNDMLYEIDNNTYYNNFVCKINYNDYDYDYKFYCSKYNKSYINEEVAYEDYLLNGLHKHEQCNEKNIFYRKNVIYDWKGWYNHYKYNNRNLHFLTALSYDNLKKVGGFCNDMKDGLWYDDDDFKYRINKICNIVPVISNDFFGIHLHHSIGSDGHHLYNNFNELITNNRNIYNYNINNNVIFCDPTILCDYNIYDNNKQFNIGLCFKIYVSDDNTNEKRYGIIQQFLESIIELFNNYDNLIIVGVIDCKLTYKLFQLLNKFSNLKFIYLNKNKGIAFATNIGIEYLLNTNCKYIFCSDDDIIIKDTNVLNYYINSMIINNIHHFCFYPLKNFKEPFELIKNSYIKIKYGFAGCFYCFTYDVIYEFGYLPILDKKYGYEHEMFTQSVIKYNYDIINSSKYINLNLDSIINSSSNSHLINTYLELFELPKYISSNFWKMKI